MANPVCKCINGCESNYKVQNRSWDHKRSMHLFHTSVPFLCSIYPCSIPLLVRVGLLKAMLGPWRSLDGWPRGLNFPEKSRKQLWWAPFSMLGLCWGICCYGAPRKFLGLLEGKKHPTKRCCVEGFFQLPQELPQFFSVVRLIDSS